MECLLSLKEPEKKIATQDALFRINVEKAFEDADTYGFFKIVRDDNRTPKETLALLEAHFGLGG